jgi:hypothetical protein
MDGNLEGLAAVIMVFGIPMAATYTFFRVRRLRSEERLAAIARDVDVPWHWNSRKQPVRGGREFCWWPGRSAIS